MKNFFVIVLLCSFFAAKASDSVSCLPKDITQETLVADGESAQKAVTIREVLGRIGARCEGGKLIDKTGKEVYFVHLLGCWGNPPANYQEQLASQARELDRLKARYTVLEILCTPTNPRSVQ